MLCSKVLRQRHHLLHKRFKQLLAQRLDLHDLKDDACGRITHVVHVVAVVHRQRRAVLADHLHGVVAPLLCKAVGEEAEGQHNAGEDVVEIWQQKRAGALLLARLHEVPPEVRDGVPRAVFAASNALHDLQHALQARGTRRVLKLDAEGIHRS